MTQIKRRGGIFGIFTIHPPMLHDLSRRVGGHGHGRKVPGGSRWSVKVGCGPPKTRPWRLMTKLIVSNGLR